MPGKRHASKELNARRCQLEIEVAASLFSAMLNGDGLPDERPAIGGLALLSLIEVSE